MFFGYNNVERCDLGGSTGTSDKRIEYLTGILEYMSCALYTVALQDLLSFYVTNYNMWLFQSSCNEKLCCHRVHNIKYVNNS